MSNQRIFLSILILLISFTAISQYQLKLDIQSSPKTSLLLYRMYGDKFMLEDTLKLSKEGSFVHYFSPQAHVGMYRISFGPKSFADIIFNQEDIWVRTDAQFPMDSMYVIQSIENQVYYDYLHERKSYLLKKELLNPVLLYYPEADDFFQTASATFESLQRNFEAWIKDKQERFSGTWVVDYISFMQPAYVPAGMTEEEQFEYMQVHFFDYTSFDKPALLYSDAYPARLIEFLSLFANPEYSREQMGDAFKRAVDIVFSRPVQDPILKDYMIEYLTDGFQQYGFDEVIVHMAENYQQTQDCENLKLKSDLQTRLENFQRLAIGKPAPVLEFLDYQQKKHTLAKINAEKLVFFFWSSSCPHCREIYPELMNLYENQQDKKVELISVSLDTDLETWKEFTKAFQAEWIQVFDGLSWDSPLVKAFNIYATPSFFVLDKAGIIIEKPLLLEELEAVFKR